MGVDVWAWAVSPKMLPKHTSLPIFYLPGGVITGTWPRGPPPLCCGGPPPIGGTHLSASYQGLAARGPSSPYPAPPTSQNETEAQTRKSPVPTSPVCSLPSPHHPNEDYTSPVVTAGLTSAPFGPHHGFKKAQSPPSGPFHLCSLLESSFLGPSHPLTPASASVSFQADTSQPGAPYGFLSGHLTTLRRGMMSMRALLWVLPCSGSSTV